MRIYAYLLFALVWFGCDSTDFSGSTSNPSSPRNADAEKNSGSLDQDSDTDRRDRDSYDTDNDLFDKGDGDNDNDYDVGTDEEGNLQFDEEEACRRYVDGYVGKVFQLPEDTQRLPDFNTITPVGEVESFQLDVPDRRWTDGFPGVEGLVEWFAIQFQAELTVPRDGRYQFKTVSDDGSKVFVDGDLVVDNDGQHSPKSVESIAIELTAGKVPLEIQWFQGPRDQIALQVFWKPPGEDWVIIPAERLRERKNCDLEDLGRFE